MVISERSFLGLTFCISKKKSFPDLFLFYVCVYLHVYHMCGITWGGQKRASPPLEEELQVVVSHHVDAGTEP